MKTVSLGKELFRLAIIIILSLEPNIDLCSRNKK